jgi:cell division protein FtsL
MAATRFESTSSENLLRRWMPLWVLPVLIVMAIGTVTLRLSIVRKTYAIDQADRQIRALKEAREKMEVRVAGLKSPRRLELIARSRFGLTQPRTDQVIYMSQSAPMRTAPASDRRK